MLVKAVCYNYHILYDKFSPNLTNSMKMSAWANVTKKKECRVKKNLYLLATKILNIKYEVEVFCVWFS